MLTKNVLDQALVLWNESECKTISSFIIVNLIDSEESQKLVCVEIKKLMSSSVTRIDGIELFNSCLHKFSSNLINEFGSYFLRICLNHHEQDTNRDLYLKTIGNVLKYMKNNHDFHKMFVSDFLVQTIDSSLKKTTNLNDQEASLDCLIACLEYYSSSCIASKNRIEELVLTFIHSTPGQISEKAGMIYFLCQKTGNAGNDGTNHTNNITEAIRRLTVTCHKLYDEIFGNEVDFEKNYENETEPLKIKMPPLHLNENLKLEYRTGIFKNLVTWLDIMLCRGLSMILYPKELLSVVQRGISIHSCLDDGEDLGVKSSLFALSLIEIQTEVLKLLETIITQMGSNLAPFSYTISKIIFDLITRCQSCKCYNAMNIKQYIYRTATIWFENAKNGIDLNLVEKIMILLIDDAFPINSSVSLNIDSSLIGKSMKMKRKYIQNKIISKDKNKSTMISSYSNDLEVNGCLSSLKFLNSMLDNIHLSVSEGVMNKLNYSLIKSVTMLQNGRGNFPLNNVKCRKILYKTLSSLYEQDSISILPSINVTLKLLLNGSKDENREIAEICTRGLNILEKICQPSCKSLCYPDMTVYTTQDVSLNNEEGIDEENDDGTDENETTGITILHNDILTSDEFVDEIQTPNISTTDSGTFTSISTEKDNMIESLNSEEPILKRKKFEDNHDLLDAFVDSVNEGFE